MHLGLHAWSRVFSANVYKYVDYKISHSWLYLSRRINVSSLRDKKYNLMLMKLSDFSFKPVGHNCVPASFPISPSPLIPSIFIQKIPVITWTNIVAIGKTVLQSIENKLHGIFTNGLLYIEHWKKSLIFELCVLHLWYLSCMTQLLMIVNDKKITLSPEHSWICRKVLRGSWWCSRRGRGEMSLLRGSELKTEVFTAMQLEICLWRVPRVVVSLCCQRAMVKMFNEMKRMFQKLQQEKLCCGIRVERLNRFQNYSLGGSAKWSFSLKNAHLKVLSKYTL